MLKATLTGPRNGINKTFLVSNPGVGLVVIVSAQRVLKQSYVTPGPLEFTIEHETVTVGTPPEAGAMFFAYVQPDPTLSLEEVSLIGLQNGLNKFFLLTTRLLPNTSLIIFKNGLMLEQVENNPGPLEYVLIYPEGAAFEPADFEPADFETDATAADLPIIVQFGDAPEATDRLRTFVAVPATALMQRLPLTGAQDSANTRYTLSEYAPAASTEPTLWVFIEGVLQYRTLTQPLAGQYFVTSPIQFIVGIAPAPTTTFETILIGSTVVQSTAFQFTLDKMSRRLGIWLARGLDEAECEEVTRETYREYMEMHQWSFLMYEGAFTADALKSQGTVQVTQSSRTVQGTGTRFTAHDIGMRFRLGTSDYGYEVTDVDPVNQRLEIHPKYAGETGTGQGYTLIRTQYNLGVDAAYIFSMVSGGKIAEIPLSRLDAVDPTRGGTGEPMYFAYRGRTERNELQIELYPTPSAPQVIRYMAVRQTALTDGAQALRGVETIILNAAAAAGCRIAMAKGGKATMEMWGTLMQSYELKAAQLLERLDALDWTRSDVAKVQGMRDDANGASEDGWYQATHDTGGGDNC